MKLLTYTTLYPDAVRARHGIFVETRLRHLIGTGQVESRVVAPVPWFPFSHPMFGSYAKLSAVPRQENRYGTEVVHPRYPLLPRVGMTIAPVLLAAGSFSAIRAIRQGGYDFDLIDAHYFYPDGVAAAWLAQRFKRPLVITARGTDINLIPNWRMPRRMIQWAAARADAIVTVCEALREALIGLGVPPSKITTLRNGVDLERFHPLDRDAVRQELGLARPTLLSVGHLTERKGHHLVIEAMQYLPGYDLLIIGDGEEETRLKNLANDRGLGERVRFLGALPQADLPRYYSAADAMVLASSREGWANVLLESMACGTPVVATNIWGTPEVVASPAAGRLVSARTAESIVAGVQSLFADYPLRSETRRYAEQFSWDDTTRGQLELFARLTGARA